MAQKAFKELKELFRERPIITPIDPDKPFEMETDTSDFAIRARLTQTSTINGITARRPIAFYSRKMIPAELNYPVHNKELLAIVSAFKAWRCYLYGANHPILVRSDHKNLTYFQTTKQLTERQTR